MALNALYIGASGLKANSSYLDTIGQNLANLNTVGYKSQSSTFRDLVYQTMTGGSGPTATSGGVNPSQAGSGVTIATASSNFTQGSITPTSRSLDAAIQGSGFFVVSDGQTTQYTRAGSFDIDANGYLVDPNTGFRVQRTGPVGEGGGSNPVFQTVGDQDIAVPLGAGAPGVETAKVNYQGNLSSTTAVNGSTSTSIEIYDSQSTARTLTVTFTNTGSNTWKASATISGGTATLAADTITFDQSGLLQSPASLSVQISGIAGAGTQTISLNLGTIGQASGLSQFGGTTTATAVSQDGSGYGTLTAVSFDQAGNLMGQFSNGRSIALAQLAIASFNNEAGLLRQGNNYYSASPASGNPTIGPSGTGGRGTVQGSSLEGSNVDIAMEFSQLVIAQRGYQINSQTITVSNETLQYLTNVIR